MLKISKSKLNELFDAISANEELYLPIKKNNSSEYGLYNENVQTALDMLNTTKSPKDLFFPQSETIVKFKMEGKNIDIESPEFANQKFVVYGVRACDAKSFDILDRVFMSDPVDEFYASRRKCSTIITAACSEPEETCFCNAFGIDVANPGGDVSTWTVGDDVYFKANNEKGEEFLSSYKNILSDADEAAVDAEKDKITKIMAELPLGDLDLSAFGEGKTKELFQRPEWDELSKTCIGCGTCTFVCPTCQCYDVRDYDTGHGVQRYRCWDSCMYSDFTRMAHGNSRKTQKERFRQRFMHKLVYFPDNNEGEFSCVGCGRCVSKCPISMNIAKVAKVLGGAK